MSNITVPRGPMRGGQSANLTRDPASAAPALRQAGQKLFTSATQARQQFEANEFNQARLGMTRELDALRLEYEQTTDPQAIETGWPERIADLRNRYVSGASNGLQDRVGLTFDTLAQSHALPVARHAQGMRVSQSAGTWRDYTLTVSNAWAQAGPEVRNDLIAQGDQMIDADLDAGFISPEEAVRRRQLLRVTGIEAQAMNLVDTAPAEFLAQADGGAFDALGGEAVERLSARSRRQLEALAAADAKAKKQATKAAAAAIGTDLSLIADLAGDGLTAAQEAAGFMERPDVQAHPDYAKAAAAIQLREAVPSLNQLSPSELQALIAQQRAEPLSAKWQAERIAVLEDLLETAQEAWSDDPVQRAGTVGFDMQPIDINGLQGTAAINALRTRRAQADELARQGYVPSASAALLSKDERTALQARLDPAQPFEQREASLRAVILGFGEDAMPLLRDLDQSAAVRQAATIMLRNGRGGVAFGNLTLQSVLRGEEKIAAGTVRLPPRNKMLATIDSVTAGYYDDDPQSKSMILEAAKAIYAADAEPLDPSSDAMRGDDLGGDEYDAFETAVQRALGGHFDGGTQLGGLQDVRGMMTELPPGVSAEAVETAWDRVLSAAGGAVTGSGRGATSAAPSLDLLHSAAANGARLAVEPDAARNMLSNVSLEPVAGAPGFYTLVESRGGRLLVKPDTDGNAFMLHLPTLLEAAQ